MRLALAPWLLLTTLAFAAATTAPADPAAAPPPVPDAARKLYDAFLAMPDTPIGRSESGKEPEYLALLKSPDADLCFLHGLGSSRSVVTTLSFRGLAELKTDRSFDVLVGWEKSADPRTRNLAVSALRDFRQNRVIAPIMDRLRNDPDLNVRANAAACLAGYSDPAIAPAMIAAYEQTPAHEKGPRSRILVALGHQHVDAAVPLAVDFFEHADVDRVWQREAAIESLIANHRKHAIDALVAFHTRFADGNEKFAANIQPRIESALATPLAKTRFALKHQLMPDTPAQYVEAWKIAAPLLTDALELKTPRPAASAPAYKDADFTRKPSDLVLDASLDARVYRPGEPILLTTTLRNTSDKPAFTIAPRPPSGWMPTMAFGIEITNIDTAETLIKIEPSDFYVGSYSGPPRFELLAPKSASKHTCALQMLLDYKREFPVKPGRYRLAFSYDPSKYAAIKRDPAGKALLAHWAAPVIDFEIKGEPIKDAAELLSLIEKKAGATELLAGLKSRDPERREFARETLSRYGDSRLEALIEAAKPPDASSPWRPVPLRTYREK